MNIFFLWENTEGQVELITPSQDQLVFPGQVRAFVLKTCREWNEFEVREKYISITEIQKAIDDGRIKECFATGSKSGIISVSTIGYSQFALKP